MGKKISGSLTFWGRSFGRPEKHSGIGQPRKYCICGQLEAYLGSPQVICEISSNTLKSHIQGYSRTTVAKKRRLPKPLNSS